VHDPLNFDLDNFLLANNYDAASLDWLLVLKLFANKFQ
jgi:hypothetical protein